MNLGDGGEAAKAGELVQVGAATASKGQPHAVTPLVGKGGGVVRHVFQRLQAAFPQRPRAVATALPLHPAAEPRGWPGTWACNESRGCRKVEQGILRPPDNSHNCHLQGYLVALLSARNGGRVPGSRIRGFLYSKGC